MKKVSYTGVFLVLLGAVLLLRELGYLELRMFQGLLAYWPVILIILGVAILLRQRWVVPVALLIVLVSGIIFILPGTHLEEPQVFESSESTAPGLAALDANVEYGAGELHISSADQRIAYRTVLETYDNEPSVEYSISEGTGYLSLKKPGAHWRSDRWEIGLNPRVPVSLDLDYGAASADIDLRELKVKELVIDTGASGTDLIFGDYATYARITAGASSISMMFPDDRGVRVIPDSGIASIDLDGFTKTYGEYVAGDVGSDDIIVEIEVGVSSVTGGIYTT